MRVSFYTGVVLAATMAADLASATRLAIFTPDKEVLSQAGTELESSTT